MIDEIQLVKKCLKNNAVAQKELYSRYAAKMFGVCLRYARDPMEAEDIMQEGFTRVFRKLDLFKGKGSLEGWVRRVIINSALNYISKNKMRYQEVDIENIKGQSVEIIPDEAISNLTQEELINLVQELPSGKRVVFNLFMYEGFSHKEIAEKLNISINTSKTQLAKAKAILKGKLETLQNIKYEGTRQD